MNILQNNRGMTLVFVALGLLLFLLFLGVAVDTGWMVYVRAQGQARIDSSALAAAGALVEKITTDKRQTRAEELANTFSDKNSVVNETVNPANVVTPMNYDPDSGNLTEISNWELFVGSGPNCNAVRVTTAVPTPVFFAGIRNVFGAGETGQEDITVSAVSHLPCPGLKLTSEGFGEFGSFALRQCTWIGKPEMCPSRDIVPPRASQVWPFIVKWNATTPVEVRQSIALQEIQTVQEAKDIADRNLCQDNKRVTVPVVKATEEQCNPNPGSQTSSTSSGLVVGFATICFSHSLLAGLDLVGIEVKCGEIASSSTGTGQCFGTYASNPILVQ